MQLSFEKLSKSTFAFMYNMMLRKFTISLSFCSCKHAHHQKSGKKPGGQKGHTGHGFTLTIPITETLIHKPTHKEVR